MISLIPQAIRSPMLSNLCSRSEQLIGFPNDEGKLMANHFNKNRIWDYLGHTLSWPTRFSDDCSTKDSITSLKSRIFWEETLPLSWKQTIAFFHTLEQRRPQIWFSRSMSFLNKCLTSYDVISAAVTLSVQKPIIKKKSYFADKENIWSFASYFWGWEASFLFRLRSTR